MAAASSGPYPGTYYDGRRATGTPVAVEVAPAALIARTRDGAEIVRWSYLRLCLIDDERLADAVRLAHGDGAQRLVIHDGAAHRPIAGRLADLGGRRARRRWAVAGLVVAAFALTGGAAGLVLALPRLSHEIALRMPASWDAALGRRAKAGLDRAFDAPDGLCAAPAGRAALERLTARLAAVAEAPAAYHPVVVDVPAVNALALPGGHIYLFRGLLERSETAEQFAGVLAHEMAHVRHRDGVARVLRQIALDALARLADGGTAVSFAQGLLGQSYSREAEAAADREGQRLLAAAGIDAAGLRDFLANMMAAQHELPRPLALFSSHPATADRIAALAPPAGGGPAMSATDWATLRAICGPEEHGDE